MKATTIKVEGELLAALEGTKPERPSLTMIEAADRYAEFVRETPNEAAWLAEWEAVGSTQPLKASGRKPRR